MVSDRGPDAGRQAAVISRVAVSDKHQRSVHLVSQTKGRPSAGIRVVAIRFDGDVEVRARGGNVKKCEESDARIDSKVLVSLAELDRVF